MGSHLALGAKTKLEVIASPLRPAFIAGIKWLPAQLAVRIPCLPPVLFMGAVWPQAGHTSSASLISLCHFYLHRIVAGKAAHEGTLTMGSYLYVFA